MRFKTILLMTAFTLVAGIWMFGLVGCAGQNPTAESISSAPPVEDPELALLSKPSGFDADKAFEHVRKQVEFGPRPVGSQALENTRAYLLSQLQSYGLKTTLDKFTATTPSAKFPKVDMTNIIAEIPGESNDILIIASHYDTKYFENIRFVGANDGGSSTGVLLEIARVLASKKPEERKIPQTLWFVFFDGEEALVSWSGTDHTYGSRHMVESLQASGKISKIKGMILLDMIGDKDLVIPKEGQSTRSMADIITRMGQKLGYQNNFPDSLQYIEDDHIPFRNANVPAVDLIDFTYGGIYNPYWHNEQDTLDKLSPQSLKAVGDTVLKALPKIAAQAH